jgi:hypothetical protein
MFRVIHHPHINRTTLYGPSLLLLGLGVLLGRKGVKLEDIPADVRPTPCYPHWLKCIGPDYYIEMTIREWDAIEATVNLTRDTLCK